MRLGVFGGSFNPVHAGHLALARHAQSELNLDHVFFVPARQSPLKPSQALMPAEFRLKLLAKALERSPGFSVSDCEIQRGGVSYTVDTLRFFSKQFGARAVIYFLCGADSLDQLDKWKSTDQIFGLCRFVAVTRPGFRWKETGFPVIRLPMDPIDVSSSRIRARLKKGESLDSKNNRREGKHFGWSSKEKQGNCTCWMLIHKPLSPP